MRVFYIFTIITNGTHQIIIFKMLPTTIPVERNLTYNFTTFAYVASHAAMPRWRPVSPEYEMSSLPLISYLSFPLRQLGPNFTLTSRWAPLVSFIYYLSTQPRPRR